jgi:predicted TIM-barrel fold metal-dependent hydrolase
MLIIDYHIHLWSPRFIPDSIRWSFAQAAAFRHWPYKDPKTIFPLVSKGVEDPDGEYLMKDLDLAGVNAAVSALVDYTILAGEEPEVPLEQIMAHYSALQEKYQGRFYAFAAIDPRRPNASELVRKALGVWKLKGLKLYPAAGFYPHDPICFPLYEICQEFDLPVIFHTSPPGVPGIPRFTHPIHIGDVQVAFRGLKIVLAHAGHEIWWQEALAVAEGHSHTYLDLSQWASDGLSNPGEFLKKLAHMRDRIGAHKILFASDHCPGPKTSGPKSEWVAWVHFYKELPKVAKEFNLSFSEKERDLMIGENAARLLKIKEGERA